MNCESEEVMVCLPASESEGDSYKYPKKTGMVLRYTRDYSMNKRSAVQREQYCIMYCTLYCINTGGKYCICFCEIIVHTVHRFLVTIIKKLCRDRIHNC